MQESTSCVLGGFQGVSLRLVPTSGPSGQDRSALYVDRHAHIKLLVDALSWEAHTPSRPILMWGPGGVGKSAVRRMFVANHLVPGRVPHSVIDFDADAGLRSPENTLMSIRRQLGRFGLRFSSFDLVWLRYWEATTGQRAAAGKVPGELTDIASILACVPIVGDVAATAAGLAKIAQPLALNMSKRYAALSGLDRGDLLSLMPGALADDLETALDSRSSRGIAGTERIALIFDGYERLHENGIDDWFINGLLGATGRSLKIVFGRDRIHWEEGHPEWRGVFVESKLEPLDEQWCEEYLDRRGVTDPNARAAVLGIAGGYPLHLEVATDLATTILQDHASWPGDLELDRRIAGVAGQLLDRLLRQLDSRSREAVLLAAIPRWFTMDILEGLPRGACGGARRLRCAVTLLILRGR